MVFQISFFCFRWLRKEKRGKKKGLLQSDVLMFLTAGAERLAVNARWLTRGSAAQIRGNHPNAL
jgi:hypothetical protein